MLRLKASHGTTRHWAPEFNAVGVKAKCFNRLIGAIEGRICIPIIVILILILITPFFPNSSFLIPNSRAPARLPLSPLQTKGNRAEAITVKINPATAMMVAMQEKFRRVSPSVIPLILLIIQNPLSFIQGKGLEPNPMTMAR